MKKLIFIFLFSLFFSDANSQNETWPKIYWKYEVTYNFDLIETYDRGYIVLNTIRPDGITPIWTWLIKTNINGEILWEKTIGDGIHATAFSSIYQMEDGGLILSGGTSLLDIEHGDVFIMKLNACGEKEWCRIVYNAGPTTGGDGCMNTYPIPGDDGYISLVLQWGDEFVPGIFKGIWLFRLDNYGEIVWIKNVFDQVDPYAYNEIPHHMFISKDTNCIITAYTGYTDYGGGGVYSKPFIMSAGMDGSEKWWVIDGANTIYQGDNKRSKEDNHGNIITVGWGWYTGAGGSKSPMLIKTDKFGNPVYRKYVIDSTETAIAWCINVVNDTIYDIGGLWKYPGQPLHAVIARTDTNGNLIMEKNVMESDLTLTQSIVTMDDKELFTGIIKDVDGYYKAILHKFNFDLEYDTAYTQSFDYDYKCNNLPIVSDTIGITDCDLWTGLPGEIEYQSAKKLVISPNPADHEITIQLPVATVDEHPWGPMTSRQYNFRYHEQSVLKIFDINGKQVKEIPLKDVQGEAMKVDISGYKPGIYLVNLFENQKQMASGKFVKK